MAEAASSPGDARSSIPNSHPKLIPLASFILHISSRSQEEITERKMARGGQGGGGKYPVTPIITSTTSQLTVKMTTGQVFLLMSDEKFHALT